MPKSVKIQEAMVLAAGLGTRMRPLTLKTPKPLVHVAGQALLQYAFDMLAKAGVQKLVVNVHHLADQIEDYVAKYAPCETVISDERKELLDSGGGIKRALPYFSQDQILLLNADTFWVESAALDDNLSQMMDHFDPDRMDILLMVVPMSRTTGHTGKGDFATDAQGHLKRFKADNESEGEDALIYAGAAILKTDIFDGVSDDIFSLNQCFDKAISAGTLYGYAMHGHWITVGTIAAIKDAEDEVARLSGIGLRRV